MIVRSVDARCVSAYHVSPRITFDGHICRVVAALTHVRSTTIRLVRLPPPSTVHADEWQGDLCTPFAHSHAESQRPVPAGQALSIKRNSAVFRLSVFALRFVCEHVSHRQALATADCTRNSIGPNFSLPQT